MKYFITFLFLTCIGLLIFPDLYCAIGFGITLTIGLDIFFYSNETFKFREWALFLYAVNYLLFPSITYQLDQNMIEYPMKIPSDYYFSKAIPMIVLFMIGMYSIPTRLFKPDLSKVNDASTINKRILLNSVYFGLLLNIFSSFIPGEFGFFIYLLSMIRFIGAFSLFSLDSRKYTYLSVLVLLLEIYNGFIEGMFHDAIMWTIFFTLFYFYIAKPSILTKIIGFMALIIFVLFIQAFKFSYRSEVSKTGVSNLESIRKIGAKKANSKSIFGLQNFYSTLNRGNQAWIFSSTVKKMDSNNNYQGMTIVNRYLESALLPRFLSENKIRSGDKEIFNRFSGHKINKTTSMALGVFADGYVAYGDWGVYIFSFVLGFIFSIIFKIIESWTKISPFYVLMLLPILHYAVRPDCELQTIVNHLSKSIFVFGVLVFFSRYQFKLDTFEAKQKLNIIQDMKKLDGDGVVN